MCGFCSSDGRNSGFINAVSLNGDKSYRHNDPSRLQWKLRQHINTRTHQQKNFEFLENILKINF